VHIHQVALADAGQFQVPQGLAASGGVNRYLKVALLIVHRLDHHDVRRRPRRYRQIVGEARQHLELAVVALAGLRHLLLLAREPELAARQEVLDLRGRGLAEVVVGRGAVHLIYQPAGKGVHDAAGSDESPEAVPVGGRQELAAHEQSAARLRTPWLAIA